MTINSSYIGEADVAARLHAQEELALKAGLRLGGTIVPPGQPLWDVGEQAKKKWAQELNSRPRALDAIGMLLMRIKAEDAKDVKGVALSRIRMDPEYGGLFSADKEGVGRPLGFTRTGFSHIAQQIRPSEVSHGFAANVLALRHDPVLMAQVFNYHADRAGPTDRVTLRTVVEPVSKLRVIRASVTPKHSHETGDDSAVVAALQSQRTVFNDGRGSRSMSDLLQHARARITREQDYSLFELIWPALNREIRTGDIGNIGIRVRNSEVKAGSVVVEAYVEQVRCYNCTRVTSTDEEADVLNLRHVGDISQRISALVAKALNRVDPFVRAFGDAFKTPLPLTRGEMLERLAKVKKLAEHEVNLIGQLWDAGSPGLTVGNSLGDLANAMTRAAQELPVDAALNMEGIAGELVAKPNVRRLLGLS